MMLVETLLKKLSMVIQQLLPTISLLELLFHTPTLLLVGKINLYLTMGKALFMMYLATHSPIVITIYLGHMADNLIALMT